MVEVVSPVEEFEELVSKYDLSLIGNGSELIGLASEWRNRERRLGQIISGEIVDEEIPKILA